MKVMRKMNENKKNTLRLKSVFAFKQLYANYCILSFEIDWRKTLYHILIYQIFCNFCKNSKYYYVYVK